MNIPLERLIEAMIATLRNDIIPHVADPYARGQAVGIIDLFNNLAPRIEWARQPAVDALAARVALLREIGEDVPDADLSASTAALSAECDRLDGIICNQVARLASLADTGDADAADAAAALAAIKQHLHDDLSGEMKLTRKPLFAEIASGGDGKKTS